MINRHSSRGRSESADERAYNLLRTSTLHRVVAERPPRGKIATPLAAIHSQHAAAWVREGPHTRLNVNVFNFSKRLQVPEQNSATTGSAADIWLVSTHAAISRWASSPVGTSLRGRLSSCCAGVPHPTTAVDARQNCVMTHQRSRRNSTLTGFTVRQLMNDVYIFHLLADTALDTSQMKTGSCYDIMLLFSEEEFAVSHVFKIFFVNLSLPSGSKTIFRSQVMNQSISYTYSVFTQNSPFCLPAKLLEKLMNLDKKFQPIYLKKCVQNNCLFVKYSLLIAR